MVRRAGGRESQICGTTHTEDSLVGLCSFVFLTRATYLPIDFRVLGYTVKINYCQR